MAIPYEVQNALESACGDRLVPTGDYKDIRHSLDHPCSSGLSPGAMAASAAILRNDPHFLEFLRLRIADIETNLGNLTVSYGDIREGLRAVAREKPRTCSPSCDAATCCARAQASRVTDLSGGRG